MKLKFNKFKKFKSIKNKINLMMKVKKDLNLREKNI